MKMTVHARGQFTSRMLLRRLIVLIALLGVGVATATAFEHPRLLALRRLAGGVGVTGDGAIGAGCTSSGCANRSGGDVVTRSLGDEEDKGMNKRDEEDEEDEEGDDVEEGADETAVEEGRGKKGKKKKGYGKMLMGLAAFTKAAMLYIMIHAVAAVAGKALIVAKVALAIAVALALKKSAEHKTTSYEIVKHPYYSQVQTHSSSVDYDHSGGGGGGYEGGSRRRRRGVRR